MNEKILAISGNILHDKEESSTLAKHISKSRLRRPRRAWVVKSFQNFSKTTSLHGYSYIINKELPWIERLDFVI